MNKKGLRIKLNNENKYAERAFLNNGKSAE